MCDFSKNCPNRSSMVDSSIVTDSDFEIVDSTCSSIKLEKLRSNIYENEVEKEIEQPNIFLCQGCNSILSESNGWVRIDKELQLMVLRSVTNFVKASDQLKVTYSEDSPGSTYVELSCEKCQELIGRIYKTTAKKQDYLRDMFCINIYKLKYYTLGSLMVKPITTNFGINKEINLLKQNIGLFRDQIKELLNRLELVENKGLKSKNIAPAHTLKDDACISIKNSRTSTEQNLSLGGLKRQKLDETSQFEGQNKKLRR